MAHLRIGVVGLGFGARVYVPVFQQMAEVEIAALADSEPGKARCLAEAHGGIDAYTDWRKLVARPDLDAICIVTPPACHREQVCAALAAGKHVLCEKPFGLNVDEARTLVDAAAAAGRCAAVDFEFRLDPGIVRLQELLAAGTIGRLRRCDVTWLTGGRADSARPWSWQHDAAAGGGVLDNWGSHIIDYMEWVCQSPISRVWGEACILVNSREDASGVPREVTAEDSCDIVCRLANGAVATMRFSNCYPCAPGHLIDLYGDRGRLLYQNAGFYPHQPSRVLLQTDSDGLQAVSLPDSAETPGDPGVWGFPRLAALFVSACRGAAAPELPDFRSGLRVRRVLDAIRQSLKSGIAAPVSDET